MFAILDLHMMDVPQIGSELTGIPHTDLKAVVAKDGRLAQKLGPHIPSAPCPACYWPHT